MTHITLNLPDNKLSFFLQLVKEFEYVAIEEIDSPISEDHKNLVREIKKNTKLNDFVDAKTFMKTLKSEMK